MTERHAIERAIRDAGLRAPISDLRDLAGGCIHRVVQASLADDRVVVAKVNAAELIDLFEEERIGLEALSSTGTVLVPTPMLVGVFEGRAVLLMSALAPGRDTEAVWATFGRELAALHLESQRVAVRMEQSWKSVGSDMAILYDALGRRDFVDQSGLSRADCALVEQHCDRFLEHAESIGYATLSRIPVLVDWNITNFSVGLQDDGFRFFSRWDYDWFRIDSRVLDFYFAARVVRPEGDQPRFTYDAGPLLEPRFARFLRAYHEVAPLSEAELRFVPEAYRFFLLNYVIRVGEHFFRPEFCSRLRREVVDTHLPALTDIDFDVLLDVLK